MTIGVANAIFIDTNVLVYANVAASPFHHQALTAMQGCAAGGNELWISRQVLREYLVTVTRPQFISPLPIATAVANIGYFEAQFRIAEDGPNVTTRLLTLLQQVSIAGRQIHDANLVATMQVYGISHLLTHNTADFTRFAHLITLVGI